MLSLSLSVQFRPTKKEERLIAELRRAVTQSLVCEDFFDVYDELDALEEGVKFTNSTCESHFERGRAALDILLLSLTCYHPLQILA